MAYCFQQLCDIDINVCRVLNIVDFSIFIHFDIIVLIAIVNNSVFVIFAENCK